MTQSIALVSLRFSPGHASHLLAYAGLVRSAGFEVSYILDEPYLSFADFAADAQVASAQQYREDPDCLAFGKAIFYNPALRNAPVARQMRRRGIDVIYIFHEPVPIRYRLAEGWKEILKLIVAKFSSIAMLRASSAVLVGSGYARRLYDRHFARYNSNVFTFPLLFEDETGPDPSRNVNGQRPCFSFLGHAVKAHDFDGFVRFAKYAVRTGSSIPFLVATRNDLTAQLARDKELARHAREGRIQIQHGRPLSNQEMNAFAAKSFCTWGVYKCSTQSGVLARSFMTGTPVLANRTGSFPEYVRAGVNGEFVDSADRLETMLQRAEAIRSNLAAYVEGARRTFLDTFDYPANQKRFVEILAQAGKE